MPSHASRTIFLTAALIAMLPSTPSWAVTAKEKMATCQFGAVDQKLQGAARAKFLKNCMANRNDPRGPTSGAAGGPPPAAGGAPPPKQ
jgi:psiF repeat-containing protein